MNLSPEAKTRRRMLRFIGRLARIPHKLIERHIRRHFDEKTRRYACPAGCPVGRLGRTMAQFRAQMLAEEAASRKEIA